MITMDRYNLPASPYVISRIGSSVTNKGTKTLIEFDGVGIADG